MPWPRPPRSAPTWLSSSGHPHQPDGGSQAVQNVLAGERYKVVGKEIKAYCRGEYGRTPAPIDPDIQKKILGDTPVVKGRYADSLEPEFEKTRRSWAPPPRATRTC